MYGIVRLLIGFVLILVATVLINKLAKEQQKKRLKYIASGGVVLFITLLGLVPFENGIYTFKSAEDVYKYYHFAEEKVEFVIEGEQSDLVQGGSRFLIVPKTADGWKIGNGSNAKLVAYTSSEGMVVTVYRYKNTKDYFVMVTDLNGNSTTVSDAYNTKFYSVKRGGDTPGQTIVTHYAHITDLAPPYSVIVNGDKKVDVIFK